MSDATAPSAPLVELGLGAAWLLGLAAVLEILDRLLGTSAVAVAIAGAVLVDLASKQAGVHWDETGPGPAPPLLLRRLSVGAGIGILVSVSVVIVGVVSGGAKVGAGAPSLWLLGAAFARSAALAVRDELLFRGIPLAAAARARIPDLAACAFAALAGGAAIALEPGASAAAITLAVSLGGLSAALWKRRRGAYEAVGARALGLFLASSGWRGELLDVDWIHGSMGWGRAASGTPAWVGAAVAAMVAVVLYVQAPAKVDTPNG